MYAEAEEVRQELVGMNIPIRPSSVYSRAARHVLRLRDWPPNRTEMLMNWLSLLPDLAHDNHETHPGGIKSDLLFNSTQLDPEAVAQFGVILSSKGYIRIIGANVVTCLTRYSPPDVSARVLDEMIAADINYRRKKLGLKGQKFTRFRDTSKRLWGVAVRTHCTAGRSEVAFQMAKRAHENGLRLSQYTYQYLLGKLEADGLNEFAAEVRSLPGCGSLDVAKRRLVIEELSGPKPILRISPDQSTAANRALALAILQRASQSGSPAYATDIVPYFDCYKTDLRGGRDVQWLRLRAYRLSHTAVSTVLLAELLHHHRRGQFVYVLWLFEKFFHVVAVPSEIVRRRLWKRHHYPPRMQLQPWSLPPSITTTTFNLRSRLWPSGHHTALVWSALVHLCESEDELFALYDVLLQHGARFQQSAVEIEHSHHHHHHFHRHGSSHHGGIAPVTAPADRSDAAHFHPFLIAFTLLRGAKYGLRILDDMQDRAVVPNAPILGTAAALQAKHGEPALALHMLDIMRGLLEQGKQEEQEEEDENAKTKQRQSLLTAYTGVVRGFADRRDLAHARQVADMLTEQLGYVEGGGGDGDEGNALTDTVLRFLRRLEVEGPYAKLEPFAEMDGDWQQQQRHSYHFLKERDPEASV
jgi:hypothetical protein